MKVLLLVCFLTVSISSGAEVDFSRQRGSNAAQTPGGRPIAVPVVQSRNNGQQQPDGQQKRQLELPTGGRPSNANAASFRQQAAVPLQQPFRAPGARPAPSASAPAQEQPKRSSPSAAAISSFAEQHQPPAQSFVPFNEASGERPQRQSAAPVRPLIPFPSSERKSPPASRGNPEFERGFPEGFTSGLPAFDFQGRMPEPDEKSEGFMDGALDGFPNLKSFGGFDAMPDTVREDVVAPPVKRLQGGGRPGGSRPSSQLTGFRPSAN